MEGLKLVVNGREYPFVLPRELTLGEAAEVEGITGQGYDFDKGGAKGMLALAFVSIRRVDPSVRLEDLEMLTGDKIDLQGPEADALPPASSTGSSENAGSSSRNGSDDSAGSPAATPAATGTPA